MSLARGRPFSVPMTRSLKDCDSWHRSDLADPLDGHLVSMAVLRRDLVCTLGCKQDIVLTDVGWTFCYCSCPVRWVSECCKRRVADCSIVSHPFRTNDGRELTPVRIEGSIERFFDQWYTEWGISIGTGLGEQP